MSGFGIDYNLAKPTRRLEYLAPRFRAAVEAAVRECNAQSPPLRAMVYETYRSHALAVVYYARGRSVRPPDRPVTNAPNNLYSWHGYGLAVDVIHETEAWAPRTPGWWGKVADVFKRHGCKWGGDWKQKDPPHFQWGLCRASPSDRARELIRTGGVYAVWRAVGALDEGDGLPDGPASSVTLAASPAAPGVRVVAAPAAAEGGSRTGVGVT